MVFSLVFISVYLERTSKNALLLWPWKFQSPSGEEFLVELLLNEALKHTHPCQKG